MEFSVVATISTDDLAIELVEQLSTEELLSLITEIDSYVCDWSFTEELYKWAKAEHKTYKAEVKEYGR